MVENYGPKAQEMRNSRNSAASPLLSDCGEMLFLLFPMDPGWYQAWWLLRPWLTSFGLLQQANTDQFFMMRDLLL